MERNQRIIDELKKYVQTESESDAQDRYNYSEVVIDGHKASSLADIQSKPITDFSVETKTLNYFITLLNASTESTTRNFSAVVKQIWNKFLSDGIDIKDTELFKIAHFCEEKSYRTKAGTTEREFLLISAIGRVKSEYKV